MAWARKVGVSDLLASAFSSTLGSTVVTYEEYKKHIKKQDSAKGTRGQETYFHSLNIDDLFKVSQLHGKFGERPEHDSGYDIYIKTLTGRTTTVRVFADESVAEVKIKIRDLDGIPPEQQRLIFASQQLENDKTLSHYKIQRESTIHLVLKMHGDALPTLYIDDSLMDSKFDYDFTGKVDKGTKYYRGGYEYHRPYGWKRYAIKVLGRFDSDTWLGEQGSRSHSSDGEWPVSYHGTGESATGSIAQDGYEMSKGKQMGFGKGIYSTPSVTVAAKYAKEFEHKGTRYKIIFQNRVCPSDLKIITDTKTADGDYWVTTHEENIRPYSICVQKVL